MKGPTRSTRRQAGFQLIELMVVLVIFGLLLAVVTPGFSRRNQWNRLQGSGREVSLRMQLARQLAVSRRVPHRLVMDMNEGSQRIYRQQPDLSWVRDPEEVFGTTGVASVIADLGGVAPSDSIEILFEPRGTVRGSDVPAVIRLVGCGEDTATVSLVRTGRVTVRMSAATEEE